MTNDQAKDILRTSNIFKHIAAFEKAEIKLAATEISLSTAIIKMLSKYPDNTKLCLALAENLPDTYSGIGEIYDKVLHEPSI